MLPYPFPGSATRSPTIRLMEEAGRMRTRRKAYSTQEFFNPGFDSEAGDSVMTGGPPRNGL